MQAPQMIQFSHPSYVTVKDGWFKKKVREYFFSGNGEVRTFTDEFNQKLIEHFTRHPPRVGDLFFIEGCFRIIKVFFNFNHDKYVIWYVHDTNADMNEVEA